MAQQVLVAARNTVQRRHFQAQAARYAFDVIATESGEEAVEIASDIKPCGIAIGTDVRPTSRIKDGFEACQAIKLGLNTRKTPLAMFSERTLKPSDRLRAHECGADGIYDGPLSAIEMLKLIDALLKEPTQIQSPPRALLLRIAEILHTKKTEAKQGFVCSYPRASAAAVVPRVNALVDRKFPVWADFRNIKAGAEWEREIQRALKQAHAVILFLSGQADSGDFLREELRMAWLFELDVIPVRIDATPYCKFKDLHWKLPQLQFVDWLD